MKVMPIHSQKNLLPVDMKLKIYFGKARCFSVPNRKIVQRQIPCLPLNWLDLRQRAMAEQIKSGRHAE